ncbi:MAG: DUF4421 domain-containing protein [Prevotella sp.]|nr:DUF4421 domain-containing protein [Prevotella sp.]
MKKIWTILLFLALLSVSAQAQDNETKRRSWPVRFVMGVKTFIDSSAVKGVDPNYIGQPKHAWSAELRSAVSYSDLDMVALEREIEEIDYWGINTHSGPTFSVGAWVGYRGYGLGLSKDVIGGHETKTFSIGATGGSYGVNIRYKDYESNTPKVRVKGDFGDGEYYEEMVWETEAPIDISSLFIDAYYMLNHNRFSYAAAYDQSLTQLRSAGSLVVGGMFYQSKVNFSEEANYMLQSMMNHTGRIKFTQGSLGAGYAYNWVPARGWLLSVMAMPMLTLLNHIKFYTYTVEYGDVSKGEKPYVLNYNGSHSYNSNLQLNYDARLSLSYQWKRYYIRAFGHYNRFRFSNDGDHGHTSDWTAYAAFGYRF